MHLFLSVKLFHAVVDDDDIVCICKPCVVVHWTVVDQFTLEFGLWSASDDPEHYLLFVSWTRCHIVTSPRLLQSGCAVTAVSPEEVYLGPVTSWQIKSLLVVCFKSTTVEESTTEADFQSSYHCMWNECLSKEGCMMAGVCMVGNTYLCSGHSSC